MKIPILRNQKPLSDILTEDNKAAEIREALEQLGPGICFPTKGYQKNRIRKVAHELGKVVKFEKNSGGVMSCWLKEKESNNQVWLKIILPELARRCNAAGVGCMACPDIGKPVGFAHRLKRRKIKPGDIKELGIAVRLHDFPCHDDLEKSKPEVMFDKVTEYYDKQIRMLEAAGV